MRIARRCLLFASLLVPLALPSCRALVKEVFHAPKVRVADVTFASGPALDAKGPLTLVLTLEVDNPNSYPLNVAYVAYTAILGRETVVEGEQREEIRIGASGLTMVKVPLTLRPETLEEVLRQVLHARALPYEFNGSVGLRAPVAGVFRIPFSRTGKLDPLDLLKRKGIGIN